MSMVVNNNMMAANTARNLNAHYGRLATSTQRLSSGLRINSAADDAAGLAIRELQRADIAALHQGARNANDAISMIQVADGSLGIIDEKLIRMKELAEQAATGTYDSTQRLMIESEYQAMASEITRIANATDFNGTKLLDGTLAGDHDGSGMVSEGKMKIHFGTGNDSAEDYYYVEIDECTSEAFGLGNNSTWQDVQRRGVAAFKDSLLKQIKNSDLSDEDKGKLLASVDKMAEEINAAISNATDPAKAYELWAAGDGGDPYAIGDDEGFLKAGKNWHGNSPLLAEFLAAGADQSGADAIIYEQYLKDKGLEPTPDAAKVDTKDLWEKAEKILRDNAVISDNKILAEFRTQVTPDIAQKDTAGWDAAAKKLKNPTDEDIYKEYLKRLTPDSAKTANKTLWDASEAKLQPSDDDILAQYKEDLTAAEAQKDTAGWTTATGNSKTETDDVILAKYKADLTAASAEAANKTLWDASKATLQPSDDDILAQYKEDLTIADAQKDTTGWEALAEKMGKSSDDDILQQYLKDLTPAKAKALDDPDWDKVEAQIRDNLTFSDNEIYRQYLANNNAQPNAADAKKNDATAWADAQKAVEIDHPGVLDAANMAKLDEFWNNLRTTEQQKLQYAFGQAAIYNLANAPASNTPINYGISAEPLDLAGLAGVDDDNGIVKGMLDKALDDMQAKVGHMDFAGHTVETQEDAQMALDAINEAIVSKDKIRAHLGAAQNRLENTVSNLNIQAENLQAAESRISDVDVATEMTQFVRNQILTQSAVAMLSQANSLPQMAMQLIGG